MNAHNHSITDIVDVLNAYCSPTETIDVVSRTIILEIAKANASGHPIREKDIVQNFDFRSYGLVHKQLKKLIDTNLVTNARNPADRRERLLYLTPLAQEKFERLAQEIRQLRK